MSSQAIAVVPTGLSPLTGSLLETGKYSDLVIKCGGKSFHVHRSVVCIQSKPLAAAVDGAFKEAIAGEIDLEDDECDIIERFLRYLYFGDYCDNRKIATATATRSTEASQIIPGVPEALVTNLKVYIMADKYDVPGIKQIAMEKYLDVLPEEGGTKSFIDSLALLFYGLPDNDRVLIDDILKYAAENYKTLIEKEEFETLCRQDGNIGFEIMQAVVVGETRQAPPPKICSTCESDCDVTIASKRQRSSGTRGGKERLAYPTFLR